MNLFHQQIQSRPTSTIYEWRKKGGLFFFAATAHATALVDSVLLKVLSIVDVDAGVRAMIHGAALSGSFLRSRIQQIGMFNGRAVKLGAVLKSSVLRVVVIPVGTFAGRAVQFGAELKNSTLKVVLKQAYSSATPRPLQFSASLKSSVLA